MRVGWCVLVPREMVKGWRKARLYEKYWQVMGRKNKDKSGNRRTRAVAGWRGSRAGLIAEITVGTPGFYQLFAFLRTNFPPWERVTGIGTRNRWIVRFLAFGIFLILYSARKSEPHEIENDLLRSPSGLGPGCFEHDVCSGSRICRYDP